MSTAWKSRGSMRLDASARVNDLFAASAYDCTPAPARQMASVLFAPVSRDPEAVGNSASVLSDAEKRRAQAFWRKAASALRAEACILPVLRRARGRLGVALVAHRFRSNGKRASLSPRAAGLLVQLFLVPTWIPRGRVFNTPHRRRHRRSDKTPRGDRARTIVFSRAEAKAVEGAGERIRTRTFFQLWTLKEAALKSIGGRGIALRPRRVPIRAKAEHRHRQCATGLRRARENCAYAIEVASACLRSSCDPRRSLTIPRMRRESAGITVPAASTSTTRARR
jgi:hypothetical protein